MARLFCATFLWICFGAPTCAAPCAAAHPSYATAWRSVIAMLNFLANLIFFLLISHFLRLLQWNNSVIVMLSFGTCSTPHLIARWTTNLRSARDRDEISRDMLFPDRSVRGQRRHRVKPEIQDGSLSMLCSCISTGQCQCWRMLVFSFSNWAKIASLEFHHHLGNWLSGPTFNGSWALVVSPFLGCDSAIGQSFTIGFPNNLPLSRRSNCFVLKFDPILKRSDICLGYVMDPMHCIGIDIGNLLVTWRGGLDIFSNPTLRYFYRL